MPATAPAKTNEARSLRVLLVDDYVDTLESIQMILESWGHQVLIAQDGLTGIELARTYHPDMVLLDILLPDLDGYQVARQLRSEKGLEGIILVAITGWDTPDHRRQSKEAGFDHFLVKPLAIETLQRLMER